MYLYSLRSFRRPFRFGVKIRQGRNPWSHPPKQITDRDLQAESLYDSFVSEFKADDLTVDINLQDNHLVLVSQQSDDSSDKS